MSLPLLPHINSFGTDVPLFYAGFSLFTLVRAAEDYFKWKKKMGFSQYCLEKGFLITVMQMPFFYASPMFLDTFLIQL